MGWSEKMLEVVVHLSRLILRMGRMGKKLSAFIPQ